MYFQSCLQFLLALECFAGAYVDSSLLDFVEQHARSKLAAPAQEQAHEADVNCVRWRPGDRGLLASAGDDGDVRIWRCTHPQAAEQGV